MNTPNLVKRIEKLQNSTQNLKWGHSHTILKSSETLWVICCGHSVYKRILTFEVKVVDTGYRIDCDFKELEDSSGSIFIGNEDECIRWVVMILKNSYPEIRK